MANHPVSHPRVCHTCRDDGLQDLQHRALYGRLQMPAYAQALLPAEASEAPRDTSEAASPLLQGDEAPLQQTVQLLVCCHRSELAVLDGMAANRKCLALYRWVGPCGRAEIEPEIWLQVVLTENLWHEQLP